MYRRIFRVFGAKGRMYLRSGRTTANTVPGQHLAVVVDQYNLAIYNIAMDEGAQMDSKKDMMNKVALSMQEKLKRLSETDLAYIRGYIDRAFIAQQERIAQEKETEQLAVSNKK